MPIYLAFAVVLGLLLWVVIYARGPWALKLVLILALPVFCIAVWNALDTYKGWPASESPPARESVYVASLVDEPRYIYLWLVPVGAGGLLAYHPGAEEPRAYRIAYSRDLHQEVQDAQELKKIGQVAFTRDEGRWRAYDVPSALPAKAGS